MPFMSLLSCCLRTVQMKVEGEYSIPKFEPDTILGLERVPTIGTGLGFHVFTLFQGLVGLGMGEHNTALLNLLFAQLW